MPLKVVSVAYPLAAAGPDAVGGAEQILSALDEALVRTGHQSIVVAHQESHVAGTLLRTRVPPGAITDELRAQVRREHQANIERALASGPVDLIHMHGIDFHEYRLPPGVPVLVTLHLPPSWYPSAIWEHRDVKFVCVSDSQRRACPLDRDDVAVIANGVAIGNGPVRRRTRNFALALGRICPEKNLHAALDAGKQAGIPVFIGGQVFPYPEHARYFREEIQPRLRDGHRFLGPLPVARKRRLLRAARCLLLPTLAPETSSLVAMEALAEGTPVVAFPSGAIPEILRDGMTGFLVENVKEMADAMWRTANIDPALCLSEAMQRFSHERMIAEYFDLYARLACNKGSWQERADVCAA
jgi:glycosyltransferase involved in cell wall biosynthesis